MMGREGVQENKEKWVRGRNRHLSKKLQGAYGLRGAVKDQVRKCLHGAFELQLRDDSASRGERSKKRNTDE